MLRLKNIRKYNNLSRKELGVKIGVSESTIAAYEQGIREVPIDKMIELTDVLRTNIKTLYGEDNINDNVLELSEEEKAYIIIRRIKNNKKRDTN